MRRLPNELHKCCRDILLQCTEFDSDASLRTAFVSDELYPFRGGLPEAASVSARVDATLEYLLPKRLSDGQPVLPLFLSTLRDRYQPGDALHDELGTLGEVVQSAMAQPEARPSPSPVPRVKPEHDTWLAKGIEFVNREDELILLQPARLSDAYVHLAGEQGEFALLNVPVDPYQSKPYMFAQVTHGRPILQGHSSRYPAGTFDYLDAQPWLREMRKYSDIPPKREDVGRQLAALAEEGIRYMIVHKRGVGEDLWLGLEDLIQVLMVS